VVDFAEKYKTKPIFLDEEARALLTTYTWPGNVRELKNIAEQISVLSKTDHINAQVLAGFLPEATKHNMPMVTGGAPVGEFANEREILYKLFFDMKKDVNELKKMFFEILQNPSIAGQAGNFTRETIMNELKEDILPANIHNNTISTPSPIPTHLPAVQIGANQPLIIDNELQSHFEVDESLNIMDKEKELILKALKKHRGRRKDASTDLGISERTLYRKIKEYDIEE
jgi:DNA-binding NtrC family response regulator